MNKEKTKRVLEIISAILCILFGLWIIYVGVAQLGIYTGILDINITSVIKRQLTGHMVNYIIYIFEGIALIIVSIFAFMKLKTNKASCIVLIVLLGFVFVIKAVELFFMGSIDAETSTGIRYAYFDPVLHIIFAVGAILKLVAMILEEKKETAVVTPVVEVQPEKIEKADQQIEKIETPIVQQTPKKRTSKKKNIDTNETIKQLKNLKELGVISDTQYQEAVGKVIDNIN